MAVKSLDGPDIFSSSAGSGVRCGHQGGAAHRDGQEEPLRQERCDFFVFLLRARVLPAVPQSSGGVV
jgi:hypothetical protein